MCAIGVLVTMPGAKRSASSVFFTPARSFSHLSGEQAQRGESGAVALLEFLLAAAGARIVAADIFQGVARRLLRGMVAVRTMYVALIMGVAVGMVVAMVMIVIAVRAMDVGLLGHRGTPECGLAPIISSIGGNCRAREEKLCKANGRTVLIERPGIAQASTTVVAVKPGRP